MAVEAGQRSEPPRKGQERKGMRSGKLRPPIPAPYLVLDDIVVYRDSVKDEVVEFLFLPQLQQEKRLEYYIVTEGQLHIYIFYLTDISANGVGVQIAAPAREGEANEELVHYLADILNVKKRSISLDKGSKSRQKMVTIDSAETSVDQVRERLSREALHE